MKTFKKALPVVGALVWALLLLPFFLGAEAAHPATDDFTFAVYTHPTWMQTGSILHVLKDALSYTLRTWRDWQGTVTGVLIMTLNPAVFSLEHYGGHVFVLLGLILIGTRVFLQHFLQKRLNLPWRAAFAALSAAQLLFLPDIVEGVYWFNGAWFYMGAQAVALMTLALGDSLSERPVRGAGTILAFALCWALLFALGMDNYITAMMTAAALLILLLGSALGLTWFHADVNMPQAQADVYAAITGAPPDDVRLITIPYCIGVALGVCVFYAIPFPHQTTPLEVKLTEYQEDMEKAEGKPIE